MDFESDSYVTSFCIVSKILWHQQNAAAYFHASRLFSNVPWLRFRFMSERNYSQVFESFASSPKNGSIAKFSHAASREGYAARMELARAASSLKCLRVNYGT